MKKSRFLALTFLACLILLSTIVFYFKPNNKSDMAIDESMTMPSTIVISNTSQTAHTSASKQTETSFDSTNYTQTIPIKMKDFIKNVESVLKGVQTRESKISSLMNILRNAETEEEKIATLQSLATLKPIEYADDLILLSQSTQESNKVRAEATNTLNKAYLLSDEDVEKIGGSTVYIQMEKIRQYVNSIINDKDTNPAEVYKTALQGYVYMESDKALDLSTDIIRESNNLTEAESNFFIETMFVDNQNLTNLLPILQQYPKKLTDSMASQLAVMSADPIILEQLSQVQKQQIIDILKAHKLDRDNPMYQIELDTINAKIEEIENSL